MSGTLQQFDGDYIIVGAGASGLSLAYHLNQAGLTHKRIVMIDKAPKTENDRTWCFWEQGENVFEPLIYRAWRHLYFRNAEMNLPLEMGDYTYKMLRGIDFYSFMQNWLAQQPNVMRVYGEVRAICEGDGCATVYVDAREWRGQYVFNSTLTNAPATHTHKHHSLLQHFLGWTIETQADVFDAATATLMDFRVPQINGDVCFVYVLPHSARTALVEFTVFGPQVWPHPQYRELLRNYINARLRVNTFAICEEEIGVIPMTDAPFEPQPSAHVFNIGTAGGCTKPSTGYTFLRIQQQAKAIASLIQKTGQPSAHHPTRQKRYGLFDSILLNVLAQQRRAGGGQRVFEDLYSRNPAWLMFKFLDEATTLREDLRVMRSTHWPTFAAAALDVVRRRVL